jgi:malate synthase
MATGEIRLSILWEWIHKRARLTAADAETGVADGDSFTDDLCRRLIAEEYDKLQRAGDRDVHDDSKKTTLPIARAIVETYVEQQVKLPWYVDLLNLTLNVPTVEAARPRIERFATAFAADGTRITENLDFE